jgi:hypothetical protein
MLFGERIIKTMDKQCIIQYQADFDKIAYFINSENNREQVEGWFKEKK